MGKKKTHERGKVKINKKGKQVDGKKKKGRKVKFHKPIHTYRLENISFFLQ